MGMPGTNNKDKEKKNKTPNGALQALAVTTTIGVELAVSVVAG